MALAAAIIPFAIYAVDTQGKLPAWPPTSWPALLWVGIPLIAVGALPCGRALGSALFALFAGGSLWLALAPYRENQWAETNEVWIWLPGLTVGATLLFAALASRARSAPGGWLTPLLITAVMAASAKLIGDGGSAGSAMMLGGLCFLSGGLMVVGLWRRDLPALRGTAAHLAWFPFALLFRGVFYAYVERVPALLALVALLAAVLPGKGRGSALLRALLALGLAGAAVYLAWPEETYGY